MTKTIMMADEGEGEEEEEEEGLPTSWFDTLFDEKLVEQREELFVIFWYQHSAVSKIKSW